jgi:hypothetical protein
MGVGSALAPLQWVQHDAHVRAFVPPIRFIMADAIPPRTTFLLFRFFPPNTNCCDAREPTLLCALLLLPNPQVQVSGRWSRVGVRVNRTTIMFGQKSHCTTSLWILMSPYPSMLQSGACVERFGLVPLMLSVCFGRQMKPTFFPACLVRRT